jgi:hypothetical protein
MKFTIAAIALCAAGLFFVHIRANRRPGFYSVI